VVLHLEIHIIRFQIIVVHSSMGFLLFQPIQKNIYLEKVLIVRVIHGVEFRHIICQIIIIHSLQIHGIELKL
jgi:hypothetical protein